MLAEYGDQLHLHAFHKFAIQPDHPQLQERGPQKSIETRVQGCQGQNS